MKYWAFLSYSHADKKWGDWLHKALENYRVPRRLIGKESRDGKVPDRVFPVFRDREELPVSADLGANINEALSESRYLIVICSPRSAQSRWVGEEIKAYKQLGREDRILALIVDGEPNASDGKQGFAIEDECFHEAMRYRMVDGRLSQARSEPIAADAREGKDGRNNAKLKLLAGLLGVNYDDLKQREQERRLRRARTVIVSAAALVGIFAALAVALFFKEREATRARDDAIQSRAAAIDAQRQTKFRASKAESDIGISLSASGDDAAALAHAVHAIELNPENSMANLLAYRLAADGSLALPERLISHTSKVTALTFSRDGRKIATGCDDGSVVVMDIEAGTRFSLSDKPIASITTLAFSPNGESLAFATGSEARQRPAVRVWDYSNSKQPALATNQFRYWDDLEIYWPLPNRIVVNSGRDWQSGGRMTQVFGNSGKKWAFVFGVGEWLSDDMGDEGEHAGGHDKLPPQGFVQTHLIESWVVAPTGTLVVHDKAKNRLSWLDLRGVPNINKPLFVVKPKDDDVVDVGDDSGVAILGINFSDRRELRMRRGLGAEDVVDSKRENVLRWADMRTHTQGEATLAKGVLIDRISSDGERVLVLESDRGPVILDRRTGKEVGALEVPRSGPDEVLTFSKNGDCVVARAGLNAVAFNRGVPGMPGRVSLPAAVESAEFDRSDKWLAVSADDKNVRVWSRAALSQRPLSLSDVTSKSSEVTGATVSTYHLKAFNGPNESQSGQDNEICRFDSGTGECKRISILELPQELRQQLHEEGHDLTDYAFSPDGRHLVITYGSLSGRPDNNAPSVAVLYDTSTGRMIGKPLQHDDDVFSPCYSPDGRWFITISDDRTVRRWDGQTGAPLGEPLRLPIRGRSAQISPDGKLIITSGGYLVDVARWQVIKQLTPALSDFYIAAFSPDGLWVATISQLSSDPVLTWELNQWDLQSALKVGGSVFLKTADSDESDGDDDILPFTNSLPRWLEAGYCVAVSKKSAWQCALPCDISSVLPLLRDCRPQVIGDNGEQLINLDCSLESVTVGRLFPQGRTQKNKCAYDFATRILSRGKTGAAP